MTKSDFSLLVGGIALILLLTLPAIVLTTKPRVVNSGVKAHMLATLPADPAPEALTLTQATAGQ